MLDKGDDVTPVYDACEASGCLPIIPLRKTPAVKKGRHNPPTCEHGTWTFAGADFKRKRTKWRCPTGECSPGSMWLKANRLHPLVPRETKRWRDLYRGRAAVERVFGRLKNEAGLVPLRVRGIEKVALHADLHPRHARLGSRPSASRSARGVGRALLSIEEGPGCKRLPA